MSASKIQFEAGPAADATGATITMSKSGIRIDFANGDTKYYYGLGAIKANNVTINMTNVPELEGPNAPKPSVALIAKYGANACHTGVGAAGQLSGNPAGAGAIGFLHGGSITVGGPTIRNATFNVGGQ